MEKLAATVLAAIALSLMPACFHLAAASPVSPNDNDTIKFTWASPPALLQVQQILSKNNIPYAIENTKSDLSYILLHYSDAPRAGRLIEAEKAAHPELAPLSLNLLPKFISNPLDKSIIEKGVSLWTSGSRNGKEVVERIIDPARVARFKSQIELERLKYSRSTTITSDITIVLLDKADRPLVAGYYTADQGGGGFRFHFWRTITRHGNMFVFSEENDDPKLKIALPGAWTERGDFYGIPVDGQYIFGYQPDF